ncbi:hypothetical protein JXA40_06900 [bacterium]|nr:hypothetical protein [candidate division CSSED10-310 bacterium]
MGDPVRKPANPAEPPRRKRPSPLRKQGRRIEESLISFAKQVFFEQYGRRPTGRPDRKLKIQFELTTGNAETESGIVPPLYEQIRLSLAETVSASGAYQRGRVYCYLCESAFCSHARPPDPNSVFSGYQANGKPEWTGFLQMLIDRRVDASGLFSDTQTLVGMVLPGRELKRRLMHGFGKSSKTYDLLAQVVLGYLTLPRSYRETSGSGEYVLTVQAVESRDPGGRFQLDLNLLCGLPESVPWMDTLAAGKHARIRRLLQKTELRIKDIQTRIRDWNPASTSASPSDLLRTIPGILNRIVRAIEHENRQSARRSRHVVRRISDNRPVAPALEDAFSAGDESILRDRHRDTFVILGPRQRIHIFSDTGIHVTSLKMTADQIESRFNRERWRAATGSEIAQFRHAIGAAG